MIVTIDWMEEWFKRFDQEYFGGKLPLPELSLPAGGAPSFTTLSSR